MGNRHPLSSRSTPVSVTGLSGLPCSSAAIRAFRHVGAVASDQQKPVRRSPFAECVGVPSNDPRQAVHVSAVEAAGCGYWRRAAEGEVFCVRRRPALWRAARKTASFGGVVRRCDHAPADASDRAAGRDNFRDNLDEIGSRITCTLAYT